jgi:hypothetical protein
MEVSVISGPGDKALHKIAQESPIPMDTPNFAGFSIAFVTSTTSFVPHMVNLDSVFSHCGIANDRNRRG